MKILNCLCAHVDENGLVLLMFYQLEDNNDEHHNEHDDDDDDEHCDEHDDVDGGDLAGVLPVVFGPDPLNPQVVPLLAETLVPSHLIIMDMTVMMMMMIMVIMIML